MKIAITTPTGHVGSAVADFLLDFGGDVSVKLLGRRPDKLRKLTQRGAQMSIGSQDDADFLTKATQDVDALFWVTPPGYGSDNVRAFQNRLGKAAATAVRTNHIPRVVNLSSIGAQFASGVGPINGLHDVEKLLDDAADNITHLRPGFFFENLLWQADSIKKRDRISLADFRLAALPDDRHPRYRRRSGPMADGPQVDRALRAGTARAGRLVLR